MTHCYLASCCTGSERALGYAPGSMLLRRVPSFQTFAKGRSWSRRLAIGVGAVVSVPAAVYCTLSIETHKNGVTFKPGAWYKGVPPLARPWQEPEDVPLVVPLVHTVEVLINGTILVLFPFKSATGVRAALMTVRASCEMARGKYGKALDSEALAVQMALKAPPTLTNKWLAALVVSEWCRFRVYLDRPNSDLIKGCQLARNLMIQSFEGEEGHEEVIDMTIDLARAYGLVGQHEKKKELLYRARQLQERCYGPNAEWCISYLRGRLLLASAHVMLGEWEQALVIVTDVLEKTTPRNLTDLQGMTILLPLLRAQAIIATETGREAYASKCLLRGQTLLQSLSKYDQFESHLAASALWADEARVSGAVRRLEWLDEDLKVSYAKLAQDSASDAVQGVDLAAAAVKEELGRRMLFVVDRLEPEEQAERSKVQAVQKQQGSEENDEVAERRSKYYLLEVVYAHELAKATRIQSLMAEGKAKPSEHRQTCTGFEWIPQKVPLQCYGSLLHTMYAIRLRSVAAWHRQVGEEDQAKALEEQANQLLNKINCRGGFSGVPIDLTPEAMLHRVEAGRLLEDLGSMYR